MAKGGGCLSLAAGTGGRLPLPCCRGVAVCWVWSRVCCGEGEGRVGCGLAAVWVSWPRVGCGAGCEVPSKGAIPDSRIERYIGMSEGLEVSLKKSYV